MHRIPKKGIIRRRPINTLDLVRKEAVTQASDVDIASQTVVVASLVRTPQQSLPIEWNIRIERAIWSLRCISAATRYPADAHHVCDPFAARAALSVHAGEVSAGGCEGYWAVLLSQVIGGCVDGLCVDVAGAAAEGFGQGVAVDGSDGGGWRGSGCGGRGRRDNGCGWSGAVVCCGLDCVVAVGCGSPGDGGR